MRKVIIMFALAMGIITANAQENVTVETTNGSEQPTLTKEVYPQKEADGDLYHGLSRKLTFDRMIPPHGLEVTYDKTVHVIFPAEVRYVDLGSPDLIAGKADGAENIIREGYRKEFSQRNEYVRHHGGRQFLHLQREVRRRTAVAQRGDVRLHP